MSDPDRRSFLGVEIDHYGLIDIDGLTSVVDAVSGVTVTSPNAISVGTDEFTEGELEMVGGLELRFSRYRGGPDGDFGRMERQQLVFYGFLDKFEHGDILTTIQEQPRITTAPTSR